MPAVPLTPLPLAPLPRNRHRPRTRSVATPRSHLDCRNVLILIVAGQPDTVSCQPPCHRGLARNLTRSLRHITCDMTLGTSLATPCCPSMPGPPPQRRQPRGAPCRSPPGTRRRRPRPRPPVPAWAGAPGSPLGGRRCGAAPITVADPCGSRSITAACPPARSWAAARATARVVFPLPPFCEISAIVRIMLCTLCQVRPSPCQPDRPADHSDSVRLSGFR